MIDARNYTANEILTDGTPVTIRAIRGDDRNEVLEAFKHLNRESVFTRFFIYKKELSDAELDEIAEVDFDCVVALVATTKSHGKEQLIAGGRYASDASLHASRSAELAFMTSDDYRGRGLASLILKHLIGIGRAQGLLRFEAEVLARNQAMLSVFRHCHLPMEKRLEEDTVHVTLSLA